MQPVKAISPWDLSAQAAQASRLRNSGDQRAQFEEAAKGFENLMVRKWIETARKSSLDPKEGAAASYQAMSDDQLAFLMTRQGGFGIAKQLVDQMMTQVKGRIAPPAEALASQASPPARLTPASGNAVSIPEELR
jgi:Rod binding domain-containing protein